jgi:hypothetical protein
VIGCCNTTNLCAVVSYGAVCSTNKRRPEFDLRQSINRSGVNVPGVIRDAARRFLLAAWELIMDLVKPQESPEPPVDTGVDTCTEGQITAMDEAPSLEADEAVTLVPSLEAESETVAPVPSPEAESGATADSIGLLLQRVADASTDEIDRLTTELRAMSHMLQTEAAQIDHQVMKYAHLTQTAMRTTKVIADHLASHRTASDKPSGEDDAPQPDPVPQEDDRAAVHEPPAGRRGDSRFHGPAHATGGSLAGVRPPGSLASV